MLSIQHILAGVIPLEGKTMRCMHDSVTDLLIHFYKNVGIN